MTELLDILAIPAAERDFDRLGDVDKRIKPGTQLPPPVPVRRRAA